MIRDRGEVGAGGAGAGAGAGAGYSWAKLLMEGVWIWWVAGLGSLLRLSRL
jgi:hypothetical protein